jgi:hypothetical protein
MLVYLKGVQPKWGWIVLPLYRERPIIANTNLLRFQNIFLRLLEAISTILRTAISTDSYYYSIKFWKELEPNNYNCKPGERLSRR